MSALYPTLFASSISASSVLMTMTPTAPIEDARFTGSTQLLKPALRTASLEMRTIFPLTAVSFSKSASVVNSTASTTSMLSVEEVHSEGRAEENAANMPSSTRSDSPANSEFKVNMQT